MLGILLKFLSITGWILLALLILLLLLLLLVLFFPVSYRVLWECSPEKKTIRAKASWLFGMLKARYHYPSPGTIRVKLFGITLYDSEKVSREPKTTAKPKKPKHSSFGHKIGKLDQSEETGTDNLHESSQESESTSDPKIQADSKPGFIEKIQSLLEKI